MSAKHPAPALPERELGVAFQSVSLLLGYPDEELLGRLALIGEAARTLPAAVGDGIAQTADRLAGAPLRQLQETYVETFDSRRRCNLFLTYFAHGDTRKRGVALLRFKQAYLRSGFVLDEQELPDHLCVVLEYAATIDQRLGWGLLLDHRAGLELLRLSLRDDGSPWAPAIESLCATFPKLRGDERDAVRRLAAEGPPQEEVGLSPYPTAPGGPTDLPMPTMPVAPGATG